MGALIFLLAAIAAADPPPDTGAPGAMLLVRSFGKDVHLEDVVAPRLIPHLQAEGAERLIAFAGSELATRLVNDLTWAYAEEHGFKVSADELKRCKAGLAKPGAAAPTDDEARKRLIGWKVNHALLEQDGGRLMAAVDGAQAVDAQRKLLERYEAAKQIGFASQKIRAAVLAALDRGWDITHDERERSAFMSGPKCLRVAP